MNSVAQYFTHIVQAAKGQIQEESIAKPHRNINLLFHRCIRHWERCALLAEFGISKHANRGEVHHTELRYGA